MEFVYINDDNQRVLQLKSGQVQVISAELQPQRRPGRAGEVEVPARVHGFGVNPGGAYRLEDVWLG